MAEEGLSNQKKCWFGPTAWTMRSLRVSWSVLLASEAAYLIFFGQFS
jgi:hypothetical protein